jgi:hypothetical protein
VIGDPPSAISDSAERWRRRAQNAAVLLAEMVPDSTAADRPVADEIFFRGNQATAIQVEATVAVALSPAPPRGTTTGKTLLKRRRDPYRIWVSEIAAADAGDHRHSLFQSLHCAVS